MVQVGNGVPLVTRGVLRKAESGDYASATHQPFYYAILDWLGIYPLILY